MATDVSQRQPAAPSAKHEAFVEQQLDRARRRIRRLDVVGSLFILGIAALAYALIMTALDRAFTLPTAVRGAALIAFVLGACAYAALIVFRQVRWTVNPHYAAKRLEETLPDAKNSLINWLDLHGEPIPSSIRAHLGRRAAKDLNEANLDDAINGRRTMLLGAALGGLLLLLAVWYIFGAGQFGSLLKRAFAPFEGGGIAPRTTIELIAPHGGDATVPVRTDVPIRVRVTDRVPRVNQPNSLKLHLRYRLEDPYIVRPLNEDADGEWSRTVVADEVQNGFWYKVSGGDSETPEFQVKVKAAPQVTRFEIHYKFRPYLGWPERDFTAGPNETRDRPNLKAMRGTEVTITAHTNRPWHQGKLVLHTGAKPRELAGEAVKDDPAARRFKFVLDQSGQYHLEFESADGEKNLDRSRYEILAEQDRKPAVALTLPGKDVKLPANGTLELEGLAADNYGLTQLRLKMKFKDDKGKPTLADKPYRPGLDLKLVDGTYPKNLDYKAVVHLDKLLTPKGEPVKLAAGDVLEYWLEAVDNCDYPEPGVNVGQTKSYFVTIEAPKDPKKQQDQRNRAEQGVKEHEKRQDEKLDNQNKQAAQKKSEKPLDPEEEEKRREKERQEFEKQAEQVAKELENQRQEQEKKGTAKGGAGEQGDKKDDTPPEGKEQAGTAKQDQKGPDKKDASQPKGDGGKNDQQGAAKNEGQQPQPQANPQGDGKGSGDQKQEPGQQGTAKDNKGDAKDNKASAQKGPGQEQQADMKGEQPQGAAKDEGDKGKKEQNAKAKQGGKENMGGGQEQGGAKQDGGAAGEKTEIAKGKDDGKKDGAGQQQQAQGGAKQQPEGATQTANSNKQGPADTKQAASAARKDGKGEASKEQQTAQGATKGKTPQTERGASKPGDQKGEGGQPNATAKKDGPKEKGEAQGSANRGATPEQRAEAGKGKTDRDPDPEATRKGRIENPTKDDLAKLEKDLQRKEQAPRDAAADELDRIREQAKDENARKAADDILKKHGADVAKKEPPPPGTAKGGEAGDKTAQATTKKATQQEKQVPPEAGEGKTAPKDQEAAKGKAGKLGEQTVKKGDTESDLGPPGGNKTGRGSNRPNPDPKGDPHNELFSGLPGELQLENLKEKLTPKFMKNLKGPKGEPWTEADKQRFLEQAQKYMEWVRQQEKAAGVGPEGKPGAGKPLLPSTGPRRVDQNPNATRDPLELGVAQPPPEYREAQRLFTAPPKK